MSLVSHFVDGLHRDDHLEGATDLGRPIMVPKISLHEPHAFRIVTETPTAEVEHRLGKIEGYVLTDGWARMH